jgi:hypothetical protein
VQRNKVAQLFAELGKEVLVGGSYARAMEREEDLSKARDIDVYVKGHISTGTLSDILGHMFGLVDITEPKGNASPNYKQKHIVKRREFLCPISNQAYDIIFIDSAFPSYLSYWYKTHQASQLTEVFIPHDLGIQDPNIRSTPAYQAVVNKKAPVLIRSDSATDEHIAKCIKYCKEKGLEYEII